MLGEWTRVPSRRERILSDRLSVQGVTDRLWSTQVVALLLLVGAVSGHAAGSTDEVDPDRVVLDVTVDADGDARWRVAYRFRLSDENATAAFEELRASIQENTTAYRERFAARMGRTVRAAENATGREMAVQNVTVETSREELTAYGVVTYRFRWTGFAAVSGDRMLVGDALDALYLDRQTTLVLSWPASYRASAVKPAADRKHDGSVAWVGPSSFESGEPRLVLEPARPTASGTPSSTAGTPADGSGSRGGFPIGGAALGGAVVVVGLGAGATMWFISRRGGTRATIPDSER